MKHTISAGGIISKKNSNKLYILFITTRKGFLSFPKGHLQINETPEEAAIREIKEEIGLKTVSIVQKLGIVARRGTERDNETVCKDVHLYLMQASEYTYQHEEDFVWIEFNRALKYMQFEEERDFLLHHKNIIQHHPSSYFTKIEPKQNLNKQYPQLSDIRKIVSNDLDLHTQALTYLNMENKVLEIGMLDGKDALLFAKQKQIIVYGMDASLQTLHWVSLIFQDHGLSAYFIPRHIDVENIITADLPNHIDMLYSRFGLNLSSTKTFFFINEVLKKMPIGGFIIIEGKTENDGQIREGRVVGPYLVMNNTGSLLRVWDEKYVLQSIVEKLHLQLIKIKRKTSLDISKKEESLYFIAKKISDYAY